MHIKIQYQPGQYYNVRIPNHMPYERKNNQKELEFELCELEKMISSTIQDRTETVPEQKDNVCQMCVYAPYYEKKASS